MLKLIRRLKISLPVAIAASFLASMALTSIALATTNPNPWPTGCSGCANCGPGSTTCSQNGNQQCTGVCTWEGVQGWQCVGNSNCVNACDSCCATAPCSNNFACQLCCVAYNCGGQPCPNNNVHCALQSGNQ